MIFSLEYEPQGGLRPASSLCRPQSLINAGDGSGEDAQCKNLCHAEYVNQFAVATPGGNNRKDLRSVCIYIKSRSTCRDAAILHQHGGSAYL